MFTTPCAAAILCLTLAAGAALAQTRPAPLDQPPRIEPDAPAEPTTQPAEDDVAQVAKKAGQFVLGYAADPRPEEMPGFVDALRRADLLRVGGGEVGPAAGFLRVVFRDNAENLEGWSRYWRAYPAEDRRVLMTMLWAADAEPAKQLLEPLAGNDDSLRRYAEALKGRRPVPLTALPFDSPLVLDALWGAYFAGGDARYALRVADALPLLDELRPTTAATRAADERTLRRFAVGDAARWSLTTNAARDDKLLEALREAVDDAPPEVAPHLSRVVAAAEAGRAQP